FANHQIYKHLQFVELTLKLLITHPHFIRLPFGRRMSLKRKTNGTRSADELLLLQNEQVIAMQGNKKQTKTEAKN
ncbi:hypothetical protein, partial [Bacteroides pyogenes]|uniref:hypothetical protein n=1 Tax=Bacteroides pyogenes TaxID=310300 RepID=UPI002430E75A